MFKQSAIVFIIKCLLEQKHTSKALFEKSCLSRSSVSRALAALREANITENTPKGITGISSELVFLILKFNQTDAELIIHSADGTFRERLEGLYSLSPDDNEFFFLQKARDEIDAQIYKSRRIITALIYQAPKAHTSAIAKGFDFASPAAELCSEAIGEEYTDSSVLYISTHYPLCLLCRNKETFGASYIIPTASDFKAILEMLNPTLVIFDGENTEELQNICSELRINQLSNPSQRLFLYEKECILRAIQKKLSL